MQFNTPFDVSLLILYSKTEHLPVRAGQGACAFDPALSENQYKKAGKGRFMQNGTFYVCNYFFMVKYTRI